MSAAHDYEKSSSAPTLLTQEAKWQKIEDLAAVLEIQYTDKVCEETLRLNEEFPIHES